MDDVDEVQVRDNLTIETLPVRIEDREMKKLKGKEIPLVKVVWARRLGKYSRQLMKVLLRWRFQDFNFSLPNLRT